MRKILCTLMCSAVLFGLAGCAKSPEKEVSSLYTGMTELFSVTADKIDACKTGKEAGEVLLASSEKMVEFSKKADEFSKSHPDFNAMKNPELSQQLQKYKEASGKFLKAISVAGVKYAKDKDYQEALKKIAQQMK